jgi:molecular chaperone DnaK (HSP70)
MSPAGSGTTRVVAAIDFGTYGTGFAWALRNDPAHTVYYEEDWPGAGSAYPKNLSALLLDRDGAVVEWGYDARRRWQATDRDTELAYHEHFKMDLQPDAPTAAPGLTPANPDAGRLVTLLLARVHAAALAHITAHARVAPEEIAWRLTVPAIWRDRERQLMRAAAERAGLPPDRLELVIEPEAAAQHCWDHPAFVGIATPGNRFVVVDAGSGTVDVTSYRVQGTVEEPRLAELSRATGGKLGASYVDAQFLGPMLQGRLGVEDSWRLTADGSVRLKLLEDWEKAKRDFDPQRRAPLNVDLPRPVLKAFYTTDEPVRARLAAAQDGEDGAIVLRFEEAKALFDHAVDPMVALVGEHLTSIGSVVGSGGPQPYLLLVGGFAESRYLQARFREAFTDRVAEVLIAPQPAVAVLFGAVKAGLRPSISSRISRFTYGLGISMPFERGRDPREKRFRDGYRVLRCRDRFAVFVHNGESLEVDHSTSWDLSPTSPTDRYFEMPIYTSQERHPRYIDSPGCTEVGRLTIDVSSTVGRPAQDRVIRVSMTFGRTEVTVRARAVSTDRGSTAGGSTDRELTTTIDFVTGG